MKESYNASFQATYAVEGDVGNRDTFRETIEQLLLPASGSVRLSSGVLTVSAQADSVATAAVLDEHLKLLEHLADRCHSALKTQVFRIIILRDIPISSYHIKKDAVRRIARLGFDLVRELRHGDPEIESPAVIESAPYHSSVVIMLKPDQCTPDELTAHLNIEPTYSRERNALASEAPKPSDKPIWVQELSSEEVGPGQLLDQLLMKFLPKFEVLRKIEEALEIEFGVASYFHSSTGCVTVKNNQLRQVLAFDAMMSISIFTS